MLPHLIIHFPSCEHLISPSHSASCISAPIYQYFRLPTDCNSAAATTFTQLEHYSTVFSSFYPSCIILALILQYHRSSRYFSLCSSVVSSSASFLLFISLQFTIPPPPTLAHTLPFPCCNKNSVKLYLFVSFALAKNHQYHGTLKTKKINLLSQFLITLYTCRLVGNFLSLCLCHDISFCLDRFFTFLFIRFEVSFLRLGK